MKKFLKLIVVFLLFGFVVLVTFIGYITLADYRPGPMETITQPVGADHVEAALSKTQFTIMDWNVGYAGLGQEMDFFYDGGTQVRASLEATNRNLKNILNFLKNNDSIDFWLIQEVDVKAKRSYHINQSDEFIRAIPEYQPVFATNYKVSFVPVPLSEPMGGVHSGLMTFSRYPISQSIRYAYPNIATWPNRLFLLDRCFVLSRFKLANGHDLCLINTHNSVYVFDSLLRVEELQRLKKVMMNEFELGNYVVAGGDWNQRPPGFKPDNDYNGHFFSPSEVQMAYDFLPDGWQWVFDTTAPTNRNNDQRYQKGNNVTTTLDYYLISPNVILNEVKVIDLEFVNSDHNPVFIKFSLQ